MDNAIPDIDGWKAHILRAAHQDTAKSAVVENLADNQVLIKIPDIDGWKAHILRAAHQDTAKSAVVENLADNQVLIKIPDIDGWKAHILRAAHQDTAKSAVVENLADNQVISYRETQRDWFGKKGKSWHVSVAVKKGDDGDTEVDFYAWV